MPYKTVDAATLKKWLNQGEALLIDVREPAENFAEHITESVLMPLASVSKTGLPNCTGKKLVMHCHKGGRSSAACEKLLAEDPNLEIYNLEGGISAWKASGLPVNSSDTFFLPLDRQVQLTIGLCLLTASLLGYFTTPIFFIVTGFLGAGLTFAGLSGFCGLAMLLAKMPWNQSSGNKTSCCIK